MNEIYVEIKTFWSDIYKLLYLFPPNGTGNASTAYGTASIRW
jgi:hypothetical protein